MLRNFQGGLKNVLRGRGLRFFQQGLIIFHKGGDFREGVEI